MDGLPDCLFKRWIHSFEEDSGAIQVFRPSDFDLPLTRAPRYCYEFRKNGQVNRIGSGPSDAMTENKGKFRKTGEKKIILFLEGLAKPTAIEILYCDDHILKIRDVSNE
jgi:hypothetical protein